MEAKKPVPGAGVGSAIPVEAKTLVPGTGVGPNVPVEAKDQKQNQIEIAELEAS